jgi:hypothetical protein
MLEHTIPVKTSSRERRLLTQLKHAPPEKKARIRLKLLKHIGLEAREKRRRELLRDVANLGGEKWEYGSFWRRWGKWFPREDAQRLFRLRDEVQQFWSSTAPQEAKQAILDRWEAEKTFAGLLQPYWLPSLELRRFELNPGNLRAQLTQALIDSVGRFARCQNPDCEMPLFVARRRDQKYCELGQCTAHAQRQYALKWWRKKRDERRLTPKGKRALKRAALKRKAKKSRSHRAR